VTAPSPSPAPAPAPVAVDLIATGRIGGLAGAFLEGRDRDLLAPASFLAPGAVPGAPPSLSASALAARAALAQSVAATNVSYGHPGAAELAAKLADPACHVVVTGQQPGLLGGPLYALTKAVAAARLAAAIERQGQPAVAVYWVATEDHDWAESTAVAVPGTGGLTALDLGPDPQPLVPLGMRTLGRELPTLLGALATAVPGDRYAAWLGELAAFTRPDARFGEAFSRLFVRLLGPRCPLLLDALHPALKAAERPHLQRLVEERLVLSERQRAVDDAIRQRGYALQVAPQPGASPLFLLAGGERRRIAWAGDDHWFLRGRENDVRPLAELLEILADNPSIVSPGVLARPAIQDAVLGTSVIVLGPGELAYLPQVAPSYECLGAAPRVALRPQAVVLDAHQRGHLADLGLSLGELMAAGDELPRRLMAAAGEDFVGPATARIRAELDALRAPAQALDPSLERPWEKTRESIEKTLELFAGKVTAAAARQGETRVGRAERLREAVLPGGRLQERVVSAAHFSGKYGERFVDALFEQLGDDPRWLQVVTP
jgi:bacillithiol biosynthesis cysteine-adding enzyme BshC